MQFFTSYSKAGYTLVAYPRITSSLRSSVDGEALHRCVSKYDTKIRNELDPPFAGLLPSHQRNDRPTSLTKNGYSVMIREGKLNTVAPYRFTG